MGPKPLVTGTELKVRAHPHIGLATITYLFSGEIMHRDSLGNEQLIRPGEVNWMTAGRGIVHSERTVPRTYESKDALDGIQLWIALPVDAEEVAPNFVHCKLEDLPEVVVGKTCVKLIAGEVLGVKSPIQVFSPLFYADVHFEDESTLSIPIPEGSESGVYIVDGKISVEGQSFSPGSLVCLKQGRDLSIESEGRARVLVFGGEMFPEKRTVWWNFVSSSKERIEEAKKMWRSGKFPKVINENEEIPLPD
jgi:hypothetical protein